jgi:hypothetical protein
MSSGSSKPKSRTRAKVFKRGDRVTWNSEAGWVTGIVQRKITSPTILKGYVRHASKEEPQYIINSDKTDHVAIHKASALKLKRPRKPARQGRSAKSSRSPKSGRSRKSS